MDFATAVTDHYAVGGDCSCCSSNLYLPLAALTTFSAGLFENYGTISDRIESRSVLLFRE